MCAVLIFALAAGLFAVASGAKRLSDYTDAGDVDEQYRDAVDFNTQLGILQGMTETSYGPKGTLTRAQLAAIIYRITTGDVEDKNKSVYADKQSFDDVTPKAWYAGYVNYCAEKGFLKGMGDNKYNPDGKLTGYQALAALLRTIGYDKNGEFTGSSWTSAIDKVAGKINTGISFDWKKELSREVTAQLAMNTMLTDIVSYSAAGGYKETGKTLAYAVFGIEQEEDEPADDNTIYGELGDLIWMLDDGTLTISGKGDMKAAEDMTSPWGEYKDDIKKVVIVDGVSSIGAYVFYDCTKLTAVSIPKSVKKIGDGAFSTCVSLSNITIPDGVTTIGDGAFYACEKLKSVTLSNKLKKIGDLTFAYCEKLSSIKIPASVTRIGDFAFNGCYSLSSVTVSEGVTEISDGAFICCEKLSSITIPASVESIGDSVFENCSPDLVIKGYAGSAAEEYAKDNNIPFEAVG